MFACIAKCTPASLALICQVLGLLLAPFPIPVFKGQSKLKSSILVFYPENTKRKEDEERAMVLISVSSLQQSRRTWPAAASEHHNPTDTWSWQAGLSLEVPFLSFAFWCSLRACFSVIQGEGRHRGYFWAGSWGGFDPPLTAVLANIPALRSALAAFEHCCDGGTCTGSGWSPACVVHFCVAQGVGCKGVWRSRLLTALPTLSSLLPTHLRQVTENT